MNNLQFDAWMQDHPMTITQAAAYLDIDRKTAERYLSGTLDIPKRVELACRALSRMNLYALDPIDLLHNDWRASDHKEMVWVCAQSELLARWHAALRYHVPARRRSEKEVTPQNPWLNPERVEVLQAILRDDQAVREQPGVVPSIKAYKIARLIEPTT